MTYRELKIQIANDLTFHGGKSFKGKLTAWLFNPSFRLILNYRLSRFFYLNKNALSNLFKRYFVYRQLIHRSCQISPKAIIGKNIKFAHPIGIVIGEGVVIGNNVTIWQNVTIGSHGKDVQEKNYPNIQNNVKIYSGAVIIGNISIGDNSTIGCLTFINKSVPNNKTVAGIPFKVLNN